ncbi:hypothetical protein LX64_01142 [Chitinophaga skermanii]|uniref:G/U mismatch-specific uracil-DNA glycosylase n=2 Tax=Chitinophaga skermanii TaxID=331697 RepID=A0A327QVS0_9BACT|nr:hypothetical protein LX64_01142 [Chitinophaga skermanii]
MAIITEHQYIHQYPVAPSSEKLVLGTIHPHDHQHFPLPFFYGKSMSIWRLIAAAFPGELPAYNNLQAIIAFLEKRKIAMSDVLLQCERIPVNGKVTALDEDLVPLQFNTGLISTIQNSQINEVLFTSGFGKNNACKIFMENILQVKIPASMRENRCWVADPAIFGRPVKLTVLYSPSGVANRSITKTKAFLQHQERFNSEKSPVQAFKIAYYREKLGGESNLFN